MIKPLNKTSFFGKRKGPVVLCILDGVALAKHKEGDAVGQALTENLDQALASWPSTTLKAHGHAVGLPSDGDMGNSEVGHNAIGSGRVFSQGSKLINQSLESGALFEGAVWKKLLSNTQNTGGTLHFIGLISDGNVHSHIDHLKAMLKRAKADGARRVRIHGLLDGRDVGGTSALDYFVPLTEFLLELSDENFEAALASGGGRMAITMDRYDANWSLVEKGWKTHVLGEGELFPTAVEAITTLRERTGALDQDLPPFVVAGPDGKPAGPILDGDSVILFNFRGDRALELTRAFESGEEFDKFPRGRLPKVEYAGIMEYDGDLHIPKNYLVAPPLINKTMGEYLCACQTKTYAISETQKYGHVTYFWNGNKLGKFSDELETYVEVLSDVVPFEERPAMKCAEITDKVLAVLKAKDHDFIRVNFPNGDMVGHTGVFQAVVASLEVMDLQIGRLIKAVKEAEGILVLTADHGNADEMYERNKKGEINLQENGKPKAKTSHSLNPVPFLIFDPAYAGEYSTKLASGRGITSITASVLNLLGFQAPEDYDPSLVEFN